MPEDNSIHRVDFTDNNFGIFMDIVGIISKNCDSMIIRNGVVSQLSDDRKTLFNVDMSNVFGTGYDILLASLSSKEKLLIPFRKQTPVNIIFESHNSEYIFYDQYSKIIFQKPLEAYLTASYKEYQEISIEHKFASVELTKQLLERMAGMADGLCADTIRVEFHDNYGIIKVYPGEVDVVEAHLVKISNLTKNVTGWCTFPIGPFRLPVNSYDVDFYLLNATGSSQICAVLRSKLGDDQLNVPILAACKSMLQD